MNTPEARKALLRTFPKLQNKNVICITNGYDETDFSRPIIERKNGKFRIVHTGFLHTAAGLALRRRWHDRLLKGAVQGVDILTRSHILLLEAMERWFAKCPDAAKEVELVLAGSTDEHDRALVQKSNMAHLIQCVGYLPHDMSVDLVRSADLLFLPMQRLPPGRKSLIVPGKTYEYMAAGKPILGAVPDGDAKDFLEECGSGLCCSPDDVPGMVTHLSSAFAAWKEGHQLISPNWEYIRGFERRTQTKVLANAFNRILQETPVQVRHYETSIR